MVHPPRSPRHANPGGLWQRPDGPPPGSRRRERAAEHLGVQKNGETMEISRVYTCIYIYIYIHTHIYSMYIIFKQIHLHKYVYIYMYIYIYMCVCVHTTYELKWSFDFNGIKT